MYITVYKIQPPIPVSVSAGAPGEATAYVPVTLEPLQLPLNGSEIIYVNAKTLMIHPWQDCYHLKRIEMEKRSTIYAGQIEYYRNCGYEVCKTCLNALVEDTATTAAVTTSAPITE